MTLDQGIAFAIIIAMMALFAWGRLRYDLVALLALLAAIAAGIVPPAQAFTGFSDDIVIIVASALLVSAAVARSGVIERLARRLGRYFTTVTQQVLALSGTVAVLAAFVKNIGALAMLIPVAFQLARRSGSSPSSLLMPMSFAALLGGTMTLIGTSPNIIVSRIREQILGEPFTMFDFLPVGAGIVRWNEVARGLKDARFNGTISLHGEYETKDLAERKQLAKEELEKLKKLLG